jgi:hypothetical protein
MAENEKYPPPVFYTAPDTSGTPSVPLWSDRPDDVPDMRGTFVDRSDPESMGAPDSWSTLEMPSLYRGLLETAAFFFDVPTLIADWALEKGTSALGIDPVLSAPEGKRPVLLSDIGKKIFEAPREIETSLTGSPGMLTRGFTASPRAAQSPEERFWAEVYYLSGSGLSFPTSLAGLFGTLRAPAAKLLNDAAGRGVNSAAARNTVGKALKGPSPMQAIVQGGREYANRFTLGMGQRPVRTMVGEQFIATTAGIGMGLPEIFADDDAKILLDLGEGIGKIDVKPSLKVIASLGIPIVAMHTPTGIALAGDITKITPLLRWVTQKARVFGGSLVAGFTDKGRTDLASRIVAAMESEPGFYQEVFLPAVEAGLFRTPGASTPIRILEDGTPVPASGGLRPDTPQALRELGLDDTRIAALDASLRGRGTNLQARIAEEQRRAERLDESFEMLKSRLGVGDEAATSATIERVRASLDDEAAEALIDAMRQASTAYEALVPTLGRAEASKIAVDLIDQARLASRKIRQDLWAKELVGTEYVDTSKFGDWAARQIAEAERTGTIAPGQGLLYKIAGRKRLEALNLTKAGEPITFTKDPDLPITSDDVLENGLFDIYGDPGTITGTRVKILDLQNFRSEVGDLMRAAYRVGKDKIGSRYSAIRNHIDEELLAAKNFSDLSPENVRNIEANRLYTIDEKSRWGPNSELGRILYKGDKPLPEEFFARFLRGGPGSGARVEAWRAALNEPQRIVEGDTVTWQQSPTASLEVAGSPNVMEAEILRRFTEMVPDGRVTQKDVDRFLRQYEEAVEKFPGLKKKFNDLVGLGKAVDEMASKLTVPSRETIFNAMKQGATAEDVVTAYKQAHETLQSRRLANVASDYLGADVNARASSFLANTKPENAARAADDMVALLNADKTGKAAAGFRAALWKAMRNHSRRINPDDGSVAPGIDTPKLREKIDELRPFLSKFFDKNSMEFLDELLKGGRLQRTGTGVAAAGTPADVMSANFAQIEAVGAAGRTMGQKIFGSIGINPLVATGMGRRIAAYTFTKIGEDKIMKLVEDALRDPERAAFLLRRFRELPDWTPSPKAERLKSEVLSDPLAVAQRGATTATDRARDIGNFAGKYIKNHSLEAIERAVRFGLIPAQAGARALTVEQDWEKGAPYIYRDNKIRAYIEAMEEDRGRPDAAIKKQLYIEEMDEDRRRHAAAISSLTGAPPEAAPISPPNQRRPMTTPINRNAVPGSTLAPTPHPFLQTPQAFLQTPQASAPQGRASAQTIAGLRDVGLDLFRGKEGGIVSLPCKPRQLVG